MTDNPIFAVAAKAQELRDQGADVITLAAGEPQAATGTYRSILRVPPQARGRTVVVGGVSKEHAMTGWRVGRLAAPPEIIASARLQVSRTITHVPTVNQRAALAAMADTGTPVRPPAATGAGARCS